MRLSLVLLAALLSAAPGVAAVSAGPALPEPAFDVVCNPLYDPVSCTLFIVACRLAVLLGGACIS